MIAEKTNIAYQIRRYIIDILISLGFEKELGSFKISDIDIAGHSYLLDCWWVPTGGNISYIDSYKRTKVLDDAVKMTYITDIDNIPKWAIGLPGMSYVLSEKFKKYWIDVKKEKEFKISFTFDLHKEIEFIDFITSYVSTGIPIENFFEVFKDIDRDLKIDKIIE